MRRRHQGVRVVMTMVHVAYRFWHWLAFGQARGYEIVSLIIELAVLYVIAYETFWRPWRVRGWLKHVYDRFSEGQAIRRRAPGAVGDSAEAQQHVSEWKSSVDRWYADTQNMLK